MTVPARLSLYTVAVTDLDRSSAFYEALGWRRSGASVAGDVAFFHAAGARLALWNVHDFSADMGNEPSLALGFRGSAMAINCDSAAQVDEVFSTAATAGAQTVKVATKTEWGGYSGYFADPDGHLWEIAFNPFWPIGDDDLPVLPE